MWRGRRLCGTSVISTRNDVACPPVVTTASSTIAVTDFLSAAVSVASVSSSAAFVSVTRGSGLHRRIVSLGRVGRRRGRGMVITGRR